MRREGHGTAYPYVVNDSEQLAELIQKSKLALTNKVGHVLLVPKCEISCICKASHRVPTVLVAFSCQEVFKERQLERARGNTINLGENPPFYSTPPSHGDGTIFAQSRWGCLFKILNKGLDD